MAKCHIAIGHLYLALARALSGSGKEVPAELDKALVSCGSAELIVNGETFQDDLVKADCYKLKGAIFRRMGRVNDAKKAYEKALKCYEGIGIKQVLADCYTELGHLCLRKAQDAIKNGKYTEAQASCLEAERHYDSAQGELGAPIGNCQKSKGDAEEKLGRCAKALNQDAVARERFEQAIEHYKTALDCYKAVQAEIETADCLYCMAKVRFEINDIEQARDDAEQALSILTRLGTQRGKEDKCLNFLNSLPARNVGG